jgi:Holliday junction resolvase-like predicted endonuclease
MGLTSELGTANWLRSRGYEVLFHNVEIFGIQIDLIVRDGDGMLTVVEVKSASRVVHVPPRQRRRLLRICSFLAGWEPVELVLAVFDGQKADLLPVDALTGG